MDVLLTNSHVNHLCGKVFTEISYFNQNMYEFHL